MNGIGITQWRGEDATYPLPSSYFAGLFTDASFVLFDDELPLLVGVTVGATVTFNFLFDGVNTVSFGFNAAQVSAGASVQLRTSSRYYGALAFGDQVSLLAGYNGATMPINSAFHQDTVRVINSQAGLYSINGVSGAINIVGDGYLLLNQVTDCSDVNISAVSVSTTTPIQPLQTINTQAPNTPTATGVSAGFQLIGDSIVTINTTAQNTITIAINIDDTLTNIKPTTSYV